MKLAVAAGADVVVVDGMQGGTAATQDVFIEHAGIPTLPAVRLAAEALAELGVDRRGAAHRLGRDPQRRRRGQGPGPRRRRGVDRRGRPAGPRLQPADLPDTRRAPDRRDRRLRRPRAPSPGHCSPLPHRPLSRSAITTQDPDLEARLDPELGRRRGWPTTCGSITMELTALARACGKSDVHHLEPEDLVALTVEAAAMARRPAGRHQLDPGR